jgi:hypothetical protein
VARQSGHQANGITGTRKTIDVSARAETLPRE